MVFASEFTLGNCELWNAQIIVNDALLLVTQAPWR